MLGRLQDNGGTPRPPRPAARAPWRRRRVLLFLLGPPVLLLVVFCLAADEALLWTAEHDWQLVARAALLCGADATSQNSRGYTALHRSIIRGHIGIAKLLVAHGTGVNMPDSSGATPLHRVPYQARLRGEQEWLEVAIALLDAGADINARDGGGASPLRYAVYFGPLIGGYESTTGLLLARGAEHDAFTAAALGELEALKRILASDPGALDAWRSDGTPLHWAARMGHVECARCLLDAGADVDAGPPRTGTPIQKAAARGHRDVVELLLKRGADPNPPAAAYWTSEGSRSSLSIARARGRDDIAELLLSHGARE